MKMKVAVVDEEGAMNLAKEYYDEDEDDEGEKKFTMEASQSAFRKSLPMDGPIGQGS